jgi:hypothetical protein
MEKLPAIRFLGSSGTALDDRGAAIKDGVPTGVLHVRTHVYGPGDIIEDPDDLAFIGAARIQELVALAQVQYVKGSPKPKEDIHGEWSAQEKARAEEAVRTAAERSRFSSALRAKDEANGFGLDASGNPTAAEKSRRVAMGG